MEYRYNHDDKAIFFNGYKSRSGGVFFVHTSLIYYGLHTNPSFGAGLPDFKRTYLRPQEELENVLTIQIEPEFSALSVYEVSRAIPGLLPYQNNDFRGVNKKTHTLYPLKKIIAMCLPVLALPLKINSEICC